MQKILAVAFILFTANIMSAPGLHAQAPNQQRAGSAATRLPTKDEVEANMKRTFGYDSSVSWTIYDIRASAIPGVADVLLAINKGNPQHIYVSESTQDAIVGEMIPFGPDPFARVRDKLKAADGPAQGAQKPAILLVEFSDLECPHCKAAQPILEKLVTDFPQIRYVFQQFPLPASMHPWALQAAEYTECAAWIDTSAFWKYVDSIYQNQSEINADNAEDKLKALATTAGLDAQNLAVCAARPETEVRIKQSVALGESLDVTQTPTVFINGRKVPGIADIPYDNLKALVQFEIDHAGK